MLLPTRFTIHASRITSSLTLFIEPEVHEVVVLHHILFEFQALLAGALCLGLASGFDKVREAGYLRADEAFLDVRMDGARRFPGGRPLANRPGARSEERRVGKECRARGRGGQEKNGIRDA